MGPFVAMLDERATGKARLAGMAAAACVMLACQSTFRGAVLVDPADVPRGKLIASFERVGCSGSVRSETVYVDYVQGVDGAPFIVERSLEGAWLIVTNHRVERGGIVFQAVRAKGVRELREYRFPHDIRQPGHYVETKVFAEPRGTRHRFESRANETGTECDLVRANPVTGERLGSVAAAALVGDGEASTVRPSSGWGFDGSSFRVGDRVLVDVGGRIVAAEVLQAPGDAYLLRFEGAPNGASTWIEPARITGRLE
jgi:hypothetical protein